MDELRIVKNKTTGKHAGAKVYINNKEIDGVTGYKIETDVSKFPAHTVILTLMVEDVTIETERDELNISCNNTHTSADEVAKTITDRLRKAGTIYP